MDADLFRHHGIVTRQLLHISCRLLQSQVERLQVSQFGVYALSHPDDELFYGGGYRRTSGPTTRRAIVLAGNQLAVPAQGVEVGALLTAMMRRPPRQRFPEDHTPSARSRAAIASRATWSAERGFMVGVHRARITFQPFRALAASATMLATSDGSTRSSEMRRSEP
jgi:hypothetical protein